MEQLSQNFSKDPLNPSTVVQAVANGDIPAIADIFTAWHEALPDVRQTAENIIGIFDFTPRLNKIVLAAADLAAEPNKNPYHGNPHFLEVFTLTALLGQHALKQGTIDRQTLALLLTAALIHDYKHDGTNNAGIEYRLEKISVDLSQDVLQTAGATDQEMDIIRAFVYMTDVSKDFSNPKAISPSESVKIYSQTKNPDSLKPELAILHRLGLADAALMLEDGDLGAALISTPLSHYSGALLAREQNRPYDPQRQVFFLDKICHRQVFSQAAQALFRPHMNQVLKDFGLAEVTSEKNKPGP